MSVLTPRIKKLGKMMVPNQSIGNTRLNVMPFEQTGEWVELPIEYKLWEPVLNKILEKIPLQKGATQHYITINSEFFTESGTQRREGIHIDGNFCVDPTFVDRSNKPIRSWGGIRPATPIETWGGLKIADLEEKADNSHVEMGWVLPYNITIPIAKYVSDTKGGLFIVSSNIGTRAWEHTYPANVGPQGSLEHMQDTFTKESSINVPANQLVFLTSNTPHETLGIQAGERRTFIRLTLNHAYDNTSIC